MAQRSESKLIHKLKRKGISLRLLPTHVPRVRAVVYEEGVEPCVAVGEEKELVAQVSICMHF
jgi:hypothetical protein